MPTPRFLPLLLAAAAPLAFAADPTPAALRATADYVPLSVH